MSEHQTELFAGDDLPLKEFVHDRMILTAKVSGIFLAMAVLAYYMTSVKIISLFVIVIAAYFWLDHYMLVRRIKRGDFGKRDGDSSMMNSFLKVHGKVVPGIRFD